MEKLPEKESVLFTKDTSKIYSLMGAIYSLDPYLDMKEIEKKVNKLSQDSISDIEEYNTRLKGLGLGASLEIMDIPKEKRYEEYIDILHSGKAIIASCTLQTEEEEMIHHITLTRVHEKILLMDPMRDELNYADKDVLKSMLNDGEKIEYLEGSSIRFNDSSVIVVEKV